MGAGTGGSSLFYLASLSHADVCLKRSLLLSKLREKKEESWGPGKSVNPQHQNLSPRPAYSPASRKPKARPIGLQARPRHFHSLRDVRRHFQQRFLLSQPLQPFRSRLHPARTLGPVSPPLAKQAPNSRFTARTLPRPRGLGNPCFVARFANGDAADVPNGGRWRTLAVAPNGEPSTAICCLPATTAAATLPRPLPAHPPRTPANCCTGDRTVPVREQQQRPEQRVPSAAAAASYCRLRQIVHRGSDVLHDCVAAK